MKLFAIIPALIVLVSLCSSKAPAPPGSISGSVFLDSNHNGIYDDCDTHLQLADVELTGADGESRIDRSNPRGNFSFEEVPVGDYALTLTSENGKWPVTLAPSVAVHSGKETKDVFVGAGLASPLLPPGPHVVGVIFEDADGDGVIDEGECSIRPANVYRIGEGEAVSNTNSVSASGTYRVSGISPSDRFAAVIPGSGDFRQSTPDPVPRDGDWVPTAGPLAEFCARGLEPEPAPEFGEDIFKLNFGFQRGSYNGVLTGVLFDDANGNGRHDKGENGLPDAQLQLTATTPFCINDWVYEQTTDENGRFRFEGIAPGEFHASLYESIDPVSGDIISPAWSGPVKVGKPQSFVELPLDVEPAALVEVFAFADLNGDGVQQPDEPPISYFSACVVAPEGSWLTTSHGERDRLCSGINGDVSSTVRISAIPLGEYRLEVNSHASPGDELFNPNYVQEIVIDEPGPHRFDVPIRPPTLPDLVLSPGEGEPPERADVCYRDAGFQQPPFDDVFDPTSGPWASWGLDEPEARDIYERGIYRRFDVFAAAWAFLANPAFGSGAPPVCSQSEPYDIGAPFSVLFFFVDYEPVEARQTDDMLQVQLRPGGGLYVYEIRLQEIDGALILGSSPIHTLFVDESYEPFGLLTTNADWLAPD